jgi:hypothetical protein
MLAGLVWILIIPHDAGGPLLALEHRALHGVLALVALCWTAGLCGAYLRLSPDLSAVGRLTLAIAIAGTVLVLFAQGAEFLDDSHTRPFPQIYKIGWWSQSAGLALFAVFNLGADYLPARGGLALMLGLLPPVLMRVASLNRPMAAILWVLYGATWLLVGFWLWQGRLRESAPPATGKAPAAPAAQAPSEKASGE